MNQIFTITPEYLQDELNETGKMILKLLDVSSEKIALLSKDQIFLILSLQKNRTYLDESGNVLVKHKGKSRGKLNLKRIQKHFQDVENSIQ